MIKGLQSFKALFQTGALFCLCLSTSYVAAQSSTTAKPNQDHLVEIEVETTFEPSSAIGLVMNNQTSLQKQNLEFRKAASFGAQSANYIVSVPVTGLELDQNTTVTAILRGGEGELAYGTVKSVLAPDTFKSALDLPQCKAGTSLMEPSINPAMLESGKMALLESLVKLRQKRRDTQSAQLAAALDSGLLERTAKLERGFGLTYAYPLTADTPPALIAQRMQRLLAVLSTYEQKKKQK